MELQNNEYLVTQSTLELNLLLSISEDFFSMSLPLQCPVQGARIYDWSAYVVTPLATRPDGSSTLSQSLVLRAVEGGTTTVLTTALALGGAGTTASSRGLDAQPVLAIGTPLDIYVSRTNNQIDDVKSITGSTIVLTIRWKNWGVA